MRTEIFEIFKKIVGKMYHLPQISTCYAIWITDYFYHFLVHRKIKLNSRYILKLYLTSKFFIHHSTYTFVGFLFLYTRISYIISFGPKQQCMGLFLVKKVFFDVKFIRHNELKGIILNNVL